jgi:asparagine synthase (glutamine-hydrolysing)
VSDGWDPASAAPGGPRPLADAGGSSDDLIAVVFNGCIYNHRDLRRELQAAGHRFETDHSDTEVLVHGWREWGAKLPRHLEGMFACGVWDRSRAILLIARDLAGEKPLYMARPPLEAGDAMVFASTPTAVLRVAEALCPDPAPALRARYAARISVLEAQAHGPGSGLFRSTGRAVAGMPVEEVDLDPVQLQFWRSQLAAIEHGQPRVHLRHWLPYGWGQTTPLMAVREVGPATYAASHDEPGMDSESRYLRPTEESREFPRLDPLTAESTERLLRESVHARLEADVPLGCFLSGGIDSGLISALAQSALAERGQRLRTFTMRMPDARYDESAAAAATARHLGTDHSTLECAPSPAEDLVGLIRQLGLPLGDSSLLPTYWLCKAARQQVAVALAGDGGDELFCGYERYSAARLLTKFGRLARLVPPAVVPHGGSKSRRERVRRFLEASRYGGYDELLRIFGPEDWRRLTGEPPRPNRGVYLPTAPNTTDFLGYLPFDLLRKTDTASMSVALEVRSPFLSRPLIRSAFATPVEALMPRGQRKGLLRRVARKYLPAEIVNRPKQGFAIPIGEWFRSDYGGLRTLLLDHLNSAEPWGPPALGIELNMKFVRQMLDEHLGTGLSGLVRRDHSQRLYMLLVLSIWAKWLGSL